MLNLSLNAVARGPVRLQGQVKVGDPFWEGTGVEAVEPLTVDLEARSVGEGVLVRGRIATVARTQCRRCIREVRVAIREEIALLFEPLSPDEASDLEGEVYPLPDRGDVLDIQAAVREQIVLRRPDHVLCEVKCRGLCPHCGTDLNQGECDCEDEAGPSAWDALKKIHFD